MLGVIQRIGQDRQAAVAPTVALSLFALIGVGGLAFDFARLGGLTTELQNGADQAALAAATQLDQQPGAIARATAAAQGLITNNTLFANETGGARKISMPDVVFYNSQADAEADNSGACPTTNAVDTSAVDAYKSARFVCVRTAARAANYALTPIVGALSSGNLTGMAVAGLGSAICKTPPVMLCNPDEPVGNGNELLDYNPTRGVGLRLVTGDATVPGNFGWLEAGLGNGASALASALGYNTPPGPCQPASGVTTKTGMTTSVLDALNTRFDIFANGNNTCPSQFGGTCSPSVNTRKDMTCDPTNAGTACKTANGWTPVTYDPPLSGGKPTALPGGATDPLIMGYPHDICQSGKDSVKESRCAIAGDGVWDRDAYFRVNYGLSSTAWRAMLGVSSTAVVTRYDVYKWEIANPNGNGSKGINFPQVAGSKATAFSYPATGTAGVAEVPPNPPTSGGQADRRVIAIAVLNCRALGLHGKSTDVPVPTWLKVFLVEPSIKRGSGSDLYSDFKDVYVEFVEKTTASGDSFGTVVRRDKPYLLK